MHGARQYGERRQTQQKQKVPSADVRELQQILSGGILVVQVRMEETFKIPPIPPSPSDGRERSTRNSPVQRSSFLNLRLAWHSLCTSAADFQAS